MGLPWQLPGNAIGSSSPTNSVHSRRVVGGLVGWLVELQYITVVYISTRKHFGGHARHGVVAKHKLDVRWTCLLDEDHVPCVGLRFVVVPVF